MSISPHIEQVARLLVDAHRDRRQILSAPAQPLALRRDDAFAVQDRVAAALGGVGGWKTGAPSAQETPIAAPLLASLIGPSPASLPASRFHRLGVEAEFAFRFGQALSPRPEPYSRDEVISAVETLHPSIEVVDSRLGPWAEHEATWKLADNQSNGFLVHGAPVRSWQGLDLARTPVELWVDDSLAVPGNASANPAGDPLRLLTWLANHLAATRGGLRPGDMVTTGSYTGLLWVEAGQKVLARHAGVGEVIVRFEVGRSQNGAG